jgi:hypothetical protein
MCARTDAATRNEANSAVVREDLAADAHQRPHLGETRSLRACVRPKQLGDECRAHAGLRDRRAGRRACDAPAEAVDEDQLQHEIDHVRGDDDLERPAQVRDAAQVALSCECDQRRGKAECGDPEVEDGQAARAAVPAERVQER